MFLKCTLILVFVVGPTGATNVSAQSLPPPPPQGDSPASTSATSSGPVAFDVVSVHEHGGDDHNMSWRTTKDGLATSNISLQSLIASAYNVKMDLISGGPSWVDTKGFDIAAKVLPGEGTKPPDLNEAERRVMLRALLSDRFHLKAHVETRILPVYDLVVAKDGPKMQLSPPASQPSSGDPGQSKERGSMSFAPGHLDAHAYKISALAARLAPSWGALLKTKPASPANTTCPSIGHPKISCKPPATKQSRASIPSHPSTPPFRSNSD